MYTGLTLENPLRCHYCGLIVQNELCIVESVKVLTKETITNTCYLVILNLHDLRGKESWIKWLEILNSYSARCPFFLLYFLMFQ